MMVKLFLKWLERKGRKSVIMDRDGTTPYLTRYYVAYPDHDQRQREDIPFNVFIHQFMKSDDPVCHDHPWNYLTIVLKGGYWEHFIDGTKKWRGPGSIVLSRGNYHWVEIEHPGKTWTLFFRGKKRKDWGFWDEEKGRWVHWKKYLDSKRKKV